MLLCDCRVKLISYAKRWTQAHLFARRSNVMDTTLSASQTFINTSDSSALSPFPSFGLGPQEALEYRKRFRGMIGVASKMPLKDRFVLSLVYTPGVAAPCLEIEKDPLTSFDYTIRGNTIALVTDG